MSWYIKSRQTKTEDLGYIESRQKTIEIIIKSGNGDSPLIEELLKEIENYNKKKVGN